MLEAGIGSRPPVCPSARADILYFTPARMRQCGTAAPGCLGVAFGDHHTAEGGYATPAEDVAFAAA